jgi:hypothetical protein
MATKSSAIQKKIETLKKGLNNKFITAAQKEKIKSQVEKLESQAKASAPKKASKPAATSLTRLQKMVNKKKYGVYKGAGVDLQKDSDRPAKAIGKRTSKSGKTYYEYRANRIDVKQPPKRYPKLEKGGYMAKGGVTEQEAKEKLIKLRNDEQLNFSIGNHGLIFMSLKNGNKKSYDNYKEAYEHYLESKGGYMAKGGELNLGIRKMAQEEGFTPKELGKDYELKMGQAVVEALTDANYHDAARKLVSLLEKNPRIAIKPDYPSVKDPKFKEKMAEIEKEYGSKYWEADDKTRNFAIKVSQKSGWDGYAIAGAFEYLVRIDGGYHKLADNIEKAMESADEMAEGGMTEHGLKIGDKITTDMFWDNQIVVENTKTNKRAQIDLETGKRKDEMEKGGYMADGGVTAKEVVESNADMVLSQIKAVKHHAEELSSVVSRKSNIEAWVVGKIERASTDLSDITHYLEGNKDKMSMGGTVRHYAHKMDKK